MNLRVCFGIIAAVLISSILAPRVLGANPALIPQTLPADSISNNEATLHGTITLNGKPARVAFQIRQAGKKRYVGHTPWQKIVRGQTNVSFSAALSGLAPDTDYEFRALALAGVAQRHGNELMFRSATQPPQAPTASTEPATDIGFATATLRGIINPNGSATTAFFEWGATTNYGNNSIPIDVDSGLADVTIESALTGLAPGTTYFYRVVATNSGGINIGNDAVFTTSLSFAATTLAASSVTYTSAVLVGNVSTTEASVMAYFEWGTTATYGNSTLPQLFAGRGNGPIAHSVSNLTVGTLYHFRIVATNAEGIAFGSDATFTPQYVGLADVETLEAGNVTGESAVLQAWVTPALPEGPTIAYFQYGTSTNYAQQTSAVTVPGVSRPSVIQISVTTLVPGTFYHFRVYRIRNGQTVYGEDRTFTTLPIPTVVTGPANVVSNTATLNGVVNANGFATTAFFQWGTTTNYGNTSDPINIGSGLANVAVQLALSGLTAGITHYRVFATNSAGTNAGVDRTFLTLCHAPAVVATVTNCAEVDLLAAIASGNTIKFECDGTITLTSPIDVSCVLTLDASEHTVTISGGGSNRLFNVGAAASLQFRNLTLADGRVKGTNGLNPGDAGQAVEAGAILMSNAVLYAESCVFSNCVVVGGRGADAPPLQPRGEGGAARGGAISAYSSLILVSNCVFAGNSASAGTSGSGTFIHDPAPSPGFGVGGAITVLNSSLTIMACEFRQNSATSRGGAVNEGGTLVAISTIFSANSAMSGGAIAVESGIAMLSGNSFYQNSALSAFSYTTTSGGALAILGGNVEVDSCSFGTNTSNGPDSRMVIPGVFANAGGHAYGGAVAVLASLSTITRSAFCGNSAQGGTGISGLGGAPAGNAYGGAIFSAGALSMTNCTLAFNRAQGGYLFPQFPRFETGSAYGGAVATTSNASISFSTIASNSASTAAVIAQAVGGGIFGGTGNLANSILSFNVSTGSIIPNSNAAGTIIDLGYNISSDASANFTAASSLNNTDPLLGSLGDYGGFTLTFPLLPGSPAIDAADPLSSPATDQRGVVRPQGPAPDIGSFERQ